MFILQALLSSFLIWCVVIALAGLVRGGHKALFSGNAAVSGKLRRFAVVICAHDEEAVIEMCIRDSFLPDDCGEPERGNQRYISRLAGSKAPGSENSGSYQRGRFFHCAGSGPGDLYLRRAGNCRGIYEGLYYTVGGYADVGHLCG